MVNYFTYNGVTSESFGVYISGTETFAVPGRDRTTISVPGRNGDLIMDNGRFANVEIRYSCFIRDDFHDRFSDFINYLAQHTSYASLTDTYHPDEMRYGVPELDFTPKTGPINASGLFTVSFNCKPQKYLVDGLVDVIYTNIGDGIDETITNPTLMVARPEIGVFGHGTFYIGSQAITVLEHSYPRMDIDSETQDAHYGAINLNAYLQVNDFPVLLPGSQVVLSDASTIEEIDITPRWWRL